MLKVTQLKAISTILKRIVVKNGETCQEVQCMQVSGGRIVACANTDSEVSALATTLGKHGISAKWEETLLPAFLAVYHSKFSSRGSAVSGKMGDLWEDSYHLPSLEALAEYKPWATDVARLKGSNSFNRDQTSTHDDAVKKKLEDGYEAFNSAKGSGGALATISATDKLEIGIGSDLVICKSASSSTEPYHAEQTLLLKLCSHLHSGGRPLSVNIAGVKRPCSRCKKVMQRFSSAYASSFGQYVHYDTNQEQSERSDSPTFQLTPPDKDGTGKYVDFRKAYLDGGWIT